MLEFMNSKQKQKLVDAFNKSREIRDKEISAKGKKYYSISHQTQTELLKALKGENEAGNIGKVLIYQSISVFHYMHSNTIHKALNSFERELHGCCIKSIDDMAEDLGMRRQNVIDCVKVLEKTGFILKVKVSGIGILKSFYYPLNAQNND